MRNIETFDLIGHQGPAINAIKSKNDGLFW